MADTAYHSGLTLADAALANLLGVLVAQVTDDDRTPVVLAALDEVLPHVASSIPAVAALVEAGHAVRLAVPGRRTARGAGAWAGAMLQAHAAVTDFLFWRGAQAMDAWRAALAPEAQPKESLK